MYITWFVRNPETDNLYAINYKVIGISPNKLIYQTRKFKFFKKEYTVKSSYDIFEHFVDATNQRILLMEQNGKHGNILTPLPVKNADKDIVEIYKHITYGQDKLNSQNLSLVKDIVTSFVAEETKTRENLIVWYQDLFTHTGRIGELAISAIDAALDYVKTNIGHEISDLEVRTFKENIIDQITEELKAVKTPRDLLKSPIVGSHYNNIEYKQNSEPSPTSLPKISRSISKENRKKKTKHPSQKTTTSSPERPTPTQEPSNTGGRDSKMELEDWIAFAEQINAENEEGDDPSNPSDIPDIEFED